MFEITKILTAQRVVRRGKDGLWYVYRRRMFPSGWRKDASHDGFKHATSAWAHLGKLTVKEQQEDQQ